MKMRAATLALATSLLLGIACSKGGPAAPSRACRQWPLRYSTDRGLTFNCEAGPVEGRCSAFPVSLQVTWTYRSRGDFVHEADVPNRLLALRRESVGCGSMASTGCAYSTVEYSYDSQGRLQRREDSARQSLSPGSTLEVTTFSEWDRHGRPTRGQVERESGDQPFTIAYDDALRVVQWSIGNRAEQDLNGNVVREVQVLDDGRVFERSYTIEAVQPVCE